MGLGATESAGNRSWDNTALPSGVGWGQPGELWVSKAGVVQFCESWLLCFYTCCSVGHSRSIKEPSWLLTLEHTCVHTHTHMPTQAHTHTHRVLPSLDLGSPGVRTIPLQCLKSETLVWSQWWWGGLKLKCTQGPGRLLKRAKGEDVRERGTREN